MLNNIEFKRFVCQKFDPDVNYSEFGEPEIEGAFEATVFQMLLDKEKHSAEFSDLQKEITGLRNQLNQISGFIDFRSLIHQVIKWNGLDIGVEYRPGDVRFKGRGYEKKMRSGYGHIRNHKGADGEALDCYLAPAFFLDDVVSDRIFEVTQLSLEDGDFDEHKFMLGYRDIQSAEQAYLKEMTYSHLGGIREVAIADLQQYKKNNFSEQIAEVIQNALSPLAEKITELDQKLQPIIKAQKS